MSVSYLLTQGLGSFTISGTTSELQVVNKGLLLLGEKKIDSLSDTNKRAVAANELYAGARNIVLELGLWKSARKLATLAQDDTHTNTAISWSSSVVTVTSASFTDVAVGDDIIISGALPAGYNGSYTVTTIDSPTANDFTYALATDPGAATAVGTTVDPLKPDWKFARQFSMPSDFVRLASIEDERSQYEIHGSKMVTDASSIKMEYIYQLTDTSLMNQALQDAVSSRLAYELSYHLDTSKAKQEAMERLFDRNIGLAKNIDASQRADDIMESDEWELGRLGADRTFRKISTI